MIDNLRFGIVVTSAIDGNAATFESIEYLFRHITRVVRVFWTNIVSILLQESWFVICKFGQKRACVLAIVAGRVNMNYFFERTHYLFAQSVLVVTTYKSTELVAFSNCWMAHIMA